MKNKDPKQESHLNKRRTFLKKMAVLPFMAGFGRHFNGKLSWDNNVPRKISAREFPELNQVKGQLPSGSLGNLKITRLIMGCNQIGGWAHARDLKYTNTLFKAYNTEQKVIESLQLAEQAGINTAFMVNSYYPTFHKYIRDFSGKMQSICQTYLYDNDLLGDIDKAADNGATALYIQGGYGDRFVKQGRLSDLAKAIEHVKKKGFQAGMGAHSLEVIKTCEREKFPVDFYVKTFHHDKYWSAHPESNRIEFSVDSQGSDDHNMIHDNMFDLFPQRTTDYMKTISKPWIAFKVLAGGAIMPKDGFRFAFENGADFICVGMFDFQVVDDVNTAIDILAGISNRERDWYA